MAGTQVVCRVADLSGRVEIAAELPRRPCCEHNLSTTLFVR